MQLDDFNFELPTELIARYPLKKRSSSKLLCMPNTEATFSHKQFTDVLDMIQAGDLLVFNDTKVIPARLVGQKTTGGAIEVLVERVLDNKRILAQVRASKSPRVGDFLLFQKFVRLEVVARYEKFYELAYTDSDRDIIAVIDTIGQIPLPPYMHRLPDENDKERYQTVYAKHDGSVAAPTAGLHFDEELLQKIKEKGVDSAYLTLHIGAGTFSPIRVDNVKTHQMHAEYLEISANVCEKIKNTKAAGKRVISVGTTSMRALETASKDGEIQPYCGETNIFIYPGYRFNCVDALITNLHLPKSSLLILVCAFGGHDKVMRAYQEAVDCKYRFYSYGDAMWIDKHTAESD